LTHTVEVFKILVAPIWVIVPSLPSLESGNVDVSREQTLTCCWLVIFRHAGVYTAEEIALVFRDKLIRLQSLYIDQFKRLHHRLREKRRQYLHAMKRTVPTPSIVL